MSRTIIVGDVHGCASELASLFSHLNVVPADNIYFVGDVLARGPDSLGVLEQLGQVSLPVSISPNSMHSDDEML